MAEPFAFPADVMNEIDSATRAKDGPSRSAHIGRALMRWRNGEDVPDESDRARHLIETAVFARIAFRSDEM